MRNLDTVTLELIKGAIQSARVEMEALIERSAMSPFIREKKDYFTAFFDRDGRLVVSTALPMAAGNLIDCIFERYPRDEMRPGDLYLYNDSYGSHGAVSHNNDMVFIAPVFSDARIVAFAEAWGHLWDIGGMVPGSISPAATDVFQEGIVVPPSRVLRDGVWNEELIRTFVRNTRFPDMVRGDLSAIMAAVRLGGRRMEEIAERFGAARSRRRLPACWTSPNGRCARRSPSACPTAAIRSATYIDSDSVSEKSYAVAVTVEKRGETITLDYSASDDQAQGAINFIMDSSVPKTMCGLYFTGQEAGVALNGGFHRAVGEVKTRPGSIVAPREPAPLGMRSHCLTRVNSSLFGAFAKATGGNVPAASSVYVLYYLRSWNKERTELDLCIEGLAVGFGAPPACRRHRCRLLRRAEELSDRVCRDGVRRARRRLRDAHGFRRTGPASRRLRHRARPARRRRRGGDRSAHGQHPLAGLGCEGRHGRRRRAHRGQSGHVRTNASCGRCPKATN